jgi:acetyltransferase-like isoleucine patch superfamily enzyme
MSTEEARIDPSVKLPSSSEIDGEGQITLAAEVVIERYVLLSLGRSGRGRLTIGSRSKIKHGSVLRCYEGAIWIGERSTVGEYCILTGHGGLEIGNGVIIAGHCYLTAAEHIIDSDVPIRFQGERANGIKISDNVWIGAHCTILDGVTIGTGTVVGAGSVVTKSLPANSVCHGSPCRVMRPRRSMTESSDC